MNGLSLFLNLSIFSLYLVCVLATGWLCRRGQDGSENHFLAGRSMGMLSVGLSIMVTCFTAVNYVSIPGEVFGHGLYVVFSFPVFFISAFFVSRYWLPFFLEKKSITAYEFLEERYSRRVRVLTSAFFILWRSAWMALALYTSGKILSALTGYNAIFMVALCGIVATAYTCMGGMKAVMHTDVIQFFVLLSGIVLSLFVALWHFNNGNPLPFLAEAGRLRPFSPLDLGFFSLDPRIRMTFWSVLIGTFVTFMTRYGADQVVMQRLFAAKSLSQARRGIWLNAIASFCVLSLLSMLGLAIYLRGDIQGEQSVIKGLISIFREFPVGLPGLVTAGILAATMSSVDSGLNACSAALSCDMKLRVSVLWQTLLCGVIITLAAMFVIPLLGAHQSIFVIINRTINGIGSPLLAIVALGMFSRKMSERGMFYGALSGMILSLIVTACIGNLALHYYAVVNFAITLLACFLVSLASHEH